MDLWIRNQDKETLTKYDFLNIKKYGAFPNHIIVAYIGNNIIDLGIYKTKERALEVLDEIQSILEQILDPNLTTLKIFVYEMPEE